MSLLIADHGFGQTTDGTKMDVEISVAPGKYFDYYHIPFTLTPENTIEPFGETRYGARRFEIGNGQFEVFIRQEAFPIKCQCNNKYIILRAPYLEEPDPEYLRVYNDLKTMLETKQGSVEVILEITPQYAQKKTDKPLTLELLFPNVFLRTAHGRYINYLGPLKEEDWE